METNNQNDDLIGNVMANPEKAIQDLQKAAQTIQDLQKAATGAQQDIQNAMQEDVTEENEGRTWSDKDIIDALFSRATGGYTYYSPMLLGYMVNDKEIDLHSGTSFDYLFVLNIFKLGTPLRNRILMHHIQGLLKIIQLIEDKHIPASVNIIGTSYFFSERTLNNLGFQLEKATLFYRVNLFINFIDLFWMYSLSKGKLAIPSVWDAKKAKITGDMLVAQKTKFEGFYQTLEARQAK